MYSSATSSGCMRVFFFFNDTATTEIYTLSLHDALPISELCGPHPSGHRQYIPGRFFPLQDRKSTRLNSSHSQISYAVFCLKKKKKRHDKSLCAPDHYPTLILTLSHTVVTPTRSIFTCTQ